MPNLLRPGQPALDQVVLLVHQRVALLEQHHVLAELGLVVDVGGVDHFVESLDQVLFEDAAVDDDALVQVEEDVREACA